MQLIKMASVIVMISVKCWSIYIIPDNLLKV